ncbi:hypothetical protein AVEN_164459-1 [Araneus ventricosus]|uniref:Uncharacterized protein n=1 Tax=Araneus ventricosus TaxID=182803 RepID=A0A4Y2Q910_ARAVE|nr:hypothetical protein AVEN_164459-1 [Araneus ventricosus]
MNEQKSTADGETDPVLSGSCQIDEQMSKVPQMVERSVHIWRCRNDMNEQKSTADGSHHRLNNKWGRVALTDPCVSVVGDGAERATCSRSSRFGFNDVIMQVFGSGYTIIIKPL